MSVRSYALHVRGYAMHAVSAGSYALHFAGVGGAGDCALHVASTGGCVLYAPGAACRADAGGCVCVLQAKNGAHSMCWRMPEVFGL